MKKRLSTVMLGIVGLASASQANTTEVQLGCMSPNFNEMDSNPVAAISLAAAKNKSAPRFRVTWNGGLASHYDFGTMLYNRAGATLKFSDAGGDWSNSYQCVYLFTRVSDKLLLDLCRKYNTEKDVAKLHPKALPDLLRSHDCRVYKIVDVTKSHH